MFVTEIFVLFTFFRQFFEQMDRLSPPVSILCLYFFFADIQYYKMMYSPEQKIIFTMGASTDN
jgi:hypothetical protein